MGHRTNLRDDSNDSPLVQTGPLPSSGAAAQMLAGGGEMGTLIRATDWSKTPVGPIEAWPQSLRTAVSILLESRFPMYIAWGPQFVQFYNDGYRPILGSTKHPAAMGRRAQETFAESWHIIGPMFEGVRKGTAVGSEDWMLPLDRHGYLEECYFTFSYSPIRDESGGVGGVLVTVSETTRRVLGERRLRTLRDLADRASVVSREDEAWSGAAEVIRCNLLDLPFVLLYRTEPGGGRPKLVEAVGFTPGPDGTLPGLERVTEGDSAAWPFAEASSTGDAQLVSQLRTRFGDFPGGPWPEPPHCALVLPISRPGTRQPYGFVVAGISARRALDDDYRGFLRLVADHLATAVANARTYTEEMKRAEALAELDRAKTTFFSNVSHEFRTPLTLMLGPLEDVLADRHGPLATSQRERLELVRRNGLRLQKLVTTLLDFARIEAGRAQLTFVPTDLSVLTAELASSFHSAVEAAGLRLEVDCPVLPEAIYVDPSMWEKVVLNLLSNAFKFTFKGHIRVALTWRGEHVELSVEDSGIGIPTEELPRIFERFHQVRSTRGRSHEGTGIGLALVQELVKLHGGEVHVQSSLGQGTTFTVRLPTGSSHLPEDRIAAGPWPLGSTGGGGAAALAEVSQWNSAEAPSLAPLATSGPGEALPALQTGARILVADDNADMRGYLTRLLSPHSTVEAVRNGEQALAAARAHPPDLILSDVMMPGMNGLGLLRALRADERTRTIPVVLLSARAGEEATVEGLRAGADDYLVKPFSANELHARVNAQLTLSRLRHQAVTAARAHAEEAHRLLVEARSAIRAREETLAVVSHDLRSPLATIYTATELLQRGLGGEERHARLLKQTESIQRSARRMERLISDLLDLASIDTGTLSLERQPHSVEDLIREVRENFEPAAVEQGLTLTSEVEPGLRSVPCDKGRVLQALANLLSNALKFTPSGGTVRLWAGQDEGGESIRFTVEDTGQGIPPEVRSHIFDRYWHATQKNREGHGLGLSIVKGIVEAHGGHITVDSEPGRGSAFSVSLPLLGAAAEALGRFPAVGQKPDDPLLGAQGSRQMEMIFATGGEIGALMRQMDWSKTRLGPIETWPQSLRTALGTCLASRFPMYIYWGPEWVQLYNDAGRPIMGAKHPHLSFGRPMREVAPELMPTIGPMFESVVRTGQATWSENQRMFLDRHGFLEEVYFTFSYAPIRDESGGVAGLHCAVTETTRTVVGERRLRTLRELAARVSSVSSVDEVYRVALQVLRGSIHDVPFALVYAVPAEGRAASLAGLIGIAREELLAPETISLDEEVRDESTWPLGRVAQSGQAELLRGLGQRLRVPADPSGLGSPASALVLPVTHSKEEPPSAFLVVGLSPFLPLDEEYRGFLNLMAGQIATAVSSTRARQEAQARAEALAELDRAKTAFFSNVSHEFRTPLTLILGPVEDALASSSRALSGGALELVRRNVLRLYKMVTTLLDFSRMEAGRAQATFVPTDLSGFTGDLASAFHSVIESAGLRLILSCPRLPEPVYVDPDMWEKVVLNLLSNAVKYTYRGEIRVGLTWEAGQAVLTVQDTGTGIPENDLPHVFERFYRVRTTQGRSHEGTGIGLALVQELVKLHGGSIAVASRLGEGTTFTVRIPGGTQHLPADRVERTPRTRSAAAGAIPYVEEARRWTLPEDASAREPSLETPLDTQERIPEELVSARILLADDNADLRAYVAGLLGRVFRNVHTVTDGRAAVEAVRQERPDLILSDVMMPRLDGFGLVRELRADARTRAIPIILLSARAGDESTVEGLQSGADDYLVKPFSARELIARVRTQLEMARVRRDVARHELAEEELRQALRARDAWLTVVGHELRTPVSALALSIQALLRSVPQQAAETSLEAVRKKAHASEKQVRKLARLAEELIDVSELVSGRLQLSVQEVDLASLVSTAIAKLEEEAVRSGSVVTLTATSPVVIRGDRARLERVVSHLLQNALKFGAGKPVEIAVRAEPGRASITLMDQGVGVAPADRERIFGRFERAASTRHYGGLGLGLWLAREILEVHGGSIAVTDTPGGGATFTLELPVESQAAHSQP